MCTGVCAVDVSTWGARRTKSVGGGGEGKMRVGGGGKEEERGGGRWGGEWRALLCIVRGTSLCYLTHSSSLKSLKQHRHLLVALNIEP